jgi:DNA-binding response OmpR family regulator
MTRSAHGIVPVSVLVVEPDKADRRFLVSALTSAGVKIIEADNFPSARTLLEAQAPTLLVAEIRLGVYNGLHLALIGRVINPQMSLVMTSRFRDPVLQQSGNEFGAVFVQKPMTQAELYTALLLAALRGPTAAAPPILPSLEAGHNQHPKVTAVGADLRDHRCKKRHRDIASFLLIEDLRQLVARGL